MGILFILHGLYLKVFVFSMAGTSSFFGSLVAAFLGVHLLFAALFGHSANGWVFSNQGGGWEYPVFWAIACFALALLGDGAHALRSSGASTSSAKKQ